ncbi:MAG: D-arabinono-1,4-lactone oxidase, partial [Chloroflexia bacterium]
QALAEMDRVFHDNDYAQYFWFPFNRQVTVQTANVTADPPTWTKNDQRLKEVKGWFEAGATHAIKPLLVRFPRLTPIFTRFASGSMPNGDEVMDQSDNMLLGDWINSMEPSLNASASFPPGPACARVRDAWTIAVELIEEYAKERRYPANLAMNMRLFGPGKALLHTIPGHEGEEICNIQITSFDNEHWEPFKDRLMARWLSIPGSRPHWAKQYQNLPGIAQTLRDVYGENLEQFLRLRDQEGIDPDKIFVNAFLNDLLFAGSSRTIDDPAPVALSARVPLATSADAASAL